MQMTQIKPRAFFRRPRPNFLDRLGHMRRKWWVILPFVALSCAAGVLTYILPRTFVSETLILVRPRDVPEDFVKDLIAGSPEERLKAIEQTILSLTNLIEILKEFGG